MESRATPRGLTTHEALVRQQRDGPNEVPAAGRTPAWRLLIDQLTHFFAGMLWVAALLALIAGMTSLAGAIAVIVLLNGVFAFLQEHKADKAAEQLHAMMPSTTRVVRDGSQLSIPVTELVVDDLVVIEAGDRIGADLRIVEAHELTVDESMLTGESLPQSRPGGSEVSAGTFALQGDAIGLVVAIGVGTRLAGIAALTDQARRPPSPLSVQTRSCAGWMRSRPWARRRSSAPTRPGP